MDGRAALPVRKALSADALTPASAATRRHEVARSATTPSSHSTKRRAGKPCSACWSGTATPGSVATGYQAARTDGRTGDRPYGRHTGHGPSPPRGASPFRAIACGTFRAAPVRLVIRDTTIRRPYDVYG